MGNILVENPDGKRALRRTRHRWVYDIKMDHRKIGLGMWKKHFLWSHLDTRRCLGNYMYLIYFCCYIFIVFCTIFIFSCWLCNWLLNQHAKIKNHIEFRKWCAKLSKFTYVTNWQCCKYLNLYWNVKYAVVDYLNHRRRPSFDNWF